MTKTRPTGLIDGLSRDINVPQNLYADRPAYSDITDNIQQQANQGENIQSTNITG